MTMRNGGDEVRSALEGAVGAAKAADAVSKVLGVITGSLLALFFVPFVALYAWNGLTPDSFVNGSYLPLVAATFVFRVVLHWVRSE